MKIQECIVVEGKDDTVAVKRALEADTIETNGSAVGENVLKRIALAQERRGVIIFTDPDVPGEKIRKIISREVPGCKHAFLKKQDAVSVKGNNLGIENASPEAIRAAVLQVREEYTAPVETNELVTRQDLVDAEMMGGEGSRLRRERAGEILNIGYANAKQFLKRLHMFHIGRDEFRRALNEILEEEKVRAEGNCNTKQNEGDS
ncbi:RNAse M5 [Alteribacillus persepolensis]|uniref:Ribonuclease M5 n=1 Tax=Alteribacillus persepolensis TaxID=568899 RepID=A0A1G8HYT9_9BACI|nr:ribonuclease M5 [Alteribacillus persepolensis]SDI11691.1 RNAse M5 [Alteribacillus persepolensis]